MKAILGIMFLAAGLAAAPALADPEPHRHGQEARDAAPAADMDGLDDMKAGGKSCKKCKKGKEGHDHGASGDADMGGGKCLGGKPDPVEARLRQLEKRVDLMQTLLEMMAEKQGGGAGGHRGGGHH